MMNEITVESNQFKESLKGVLVEILQENRDLFQEMLTEIIEDVLLEQEINEGEKTEPVNENLIMAKLEQKLCE
ncbi:MAG: hypothetical protein ACKN9E_14815 [Microcystaceae cyanobacterium]